MVPLIQLSKVEKSYVSQKRAFRCNDLSFEKGKKVAIAGATGSGKSTLLRIIGGLEKPEKGSVFFKDESVYPKLDRLIPGHPDMSYLSQMNELSKFIPVEEFLDTYTYGVENIERIARLCGIDHLLEKDTRALSGGERQRVALAKVLLTEPEVLLLDEPFSSLDPHHKKLMKEAVNNIEQAIDATVIIVSHDPIDVLSWADEILVMKSGEVIQRGRPKDIYFQPLNAYVAGLFGLFLEISKRRWLNGNSTEEMIFIRPEQFEIVKENQGVKGQIKHVTFKGSHDLLTIESENGMVQTLSPVDKYEKGKEVFIKFNQYSVHS